MRTSFSGGKRGTAETARDDPHGEYLKRNRWFESGSLQRGVCCEPDPLDQGAELQLAGHRMPDFWHEQIPDGFIHNALDAFELYPTTIFQILTKRAGRMRRFITDRYGSGRVPAHLWLGVTCEDNRVKRLLDILRATKDRAGDFTAFTSIEPITAPCDEIDLTGIDWVITDGESGPHALEIELSGAPGCSLTSVDKQGRRSMLR
jgi:protein gp37